MLRCNTENIIEKFVAVFTLILNIMNCENGFDIFKTHSVRIIAAVIKRSQRTLPVVTVNDIRFPINNRNDFEHCPCKECKTLCIIIVTIDTITLKVILIIKEIIDNTICFRLKHTAVLSAPGNRNRN